MLKNKLVLFFTVVFSIFAVSVAGISTFAWFQQTYNAGSALNGGTVQSGSTDLEIDGVTGYKYAYDDSGDGVDYGTGHVTSYGAYGNADINTNEEEDSPADVPAQGVGFYIKGDETWASTKGGGKNPWRYESSYKFSEKSGDYYGVALNLDFVANEQIKIYWHHFVNGSSTSTLITNYKNTIKEGNSTPAFSSCITFADNIYTFDVAGNYSIWISGRTNTTPELEFVLNSRAAVQNSLPSVKRKVNRANATDKGKFVIDVSSVSWWTNDGAMARCWFDNGSKAAYGSFSNNKTTITVPSGAGDGTLYIGRCWNSDNQMVNQVSIQYNSVFTGQTIKIKSDNIYWDIAAGDYIVGQGGSLANTRTWTVGGGIYMDDPTDSDNLHQEAVTLNASTTFRVVYVDGSGYVGWREINTGNFTNDTSAFNTPGNASANLVIQRKITGIVYVNKDELGNKVYIQLNSYTISFKYVVLDANDNYLIGPLEYKQDETIKSGATLSVPANPVSDSYQVISYWHVSYTSPTTFGSTYTAQAIFADLTLFAKFKVKPVTINVNKTLLYASGAVRSTTSLTTWNDVYLGLTYKNVSFYNTDPSPTDNFEFVGYYTAATGGSLINDSYTGWSANQTIYARYTPIATTVTIYRTYFLEGATEDCNSIVPSEYKTALTDVPLAYYAEQPYVPSATINDVYFVSENTWYVFKREGSSFYATSDCSGEPFTITGSNLSSISPGYTLYVKMRVVPLKDIKVAKPTNANNGVLGWSSVKVDIKNVADVTKNATFELTEDVTNRIYSMRIPYVQDSFNVEFILFNGYFSTVANAEKGGSNNRAPAIRFTTSDYASTPHSNANGDDYDVIQLWDTSENNMPKWSWEDSSSYTYKIVGVNISTDGLSWDYDSGIELEFDKVDPDIYAKVEKITLNSYMQFKITDKFNSVWMGYDEIDTNDDETLLYVEAATNDGNINHNIKIKDGITGVFDVLIINGQNNTKKIQVHDANRGGIIYFENPTGTESSKAFNMGLGGKEVDYAGDGNILVYEQGIKVQAGDTFAIRRRSQGAYTWFDYSDIKESDSTTKGYVEDAGSVTLGETALDPITQEVIANSSKLVSHAFRFKTKGLFNIYVYEESEVIYVAITSTTATGYGYYIVPKGNASDTTAALLDDGIKMRTLANSNANKAMYTGLYAKKDEAFCFKMQDVNDAGQLVDTTFVNFNDSIYYDSNYGLYESQSAQNKWFTLAQSSAFVKFKEAGYYNIYIRNDNGYPLVSIVKSQTGQGNFFTMNGISSAAASVDDVKSYNTTLIIRVDFKVKSQLDARIDTRVEKKTGNGIMPYLNYYAVYDVDFNYEDKYNYLREHYYDSLMAYDSTNEVYACNYSNSAVIGTTNHTGSDNKTSYSVYIMMDYSPDKVDDLFSTGYINSNFFFTISLVQGS